MWAAVSPIATRWADTIEASTALSSESSAIVTVSVGVAPSLSTIEVTAVCSASSPSNAALTCAAGSKTVAVAPRDTNADPCVRTSATVSFGATMLEIRPSVCMVARPLPAASIAAAVSDTVSIWVPKCACSGISAAAVAALVAVPSARISTPKSAPSDVKPAMCATMFACVSDTSSAVLPARWACSGTNPMAIATVTGLLSVSVTVPRWLPSASKSVLSATTEAALSVTAIGDPANAAANVCSPAAASAETAPMSVGVTVSNRAPRATNPAASASMLAIVSDTAATIANDVSAAPFATTAAAVSAIVSTKPPLP